MLLGFLGNVTDIYQLYEIFVIKHERLLRVDKRLPGYESQSNHLTGSCRPITDCHKFLL